MTRYRSLVARPPVDPRCIECSYCGAGAGRPCGGKVRLIAALSHTPRLSSLRRKFERWEAVRWRHASEQGVAFDQHDQSEERAWLAEHFALLDGRVADALSESPAHARSLRRARWPR